MGRLLRKCGCRYTMDENIVVCDKCHQPFRFAHPAKFSLHDRYQHYRRKMREYSKKVRGVE